MCYYKQHSSDPGKCSVGRPRLVKIQDEEHKVKMCKHHWDFLCEEWANFFIEEEK